MTGTSEDVMVRIKKNEFRRFGHVQRMSDERVAYLLYVETVVFGDSFPLIIQNEFTDNEFQKWYKAIKDANKKPPTMDFVRNKINEIKDALMYEFKKSAKLSPWLRRLKPGQCGVPLPETKTVPKMSTSAPKEQKSLAIGGQVTKSAKKSTWNLFSKKNVEIVQKVTNTAPFCGGQTRTPEPKERQLLAVAGGVTKRAQISTSKGRPTLAHSGMLVPETNTVSRMSTPQPKDQKSPAITGRFTKSAQKSTWKGRPMPAYSGIVLPETNSVPKICTPQR